MHVRVLNQKLDLSVEGKMRENEKWLPAFPLKAGKYVDYGFRFK